MPLFSVPLFWAWRCNFFSWGGGLSTHDSFSGELFFHIEVLVLMKFIRHYADEPSSYRIKTPTAMIYFDTDYLAILMRSVGFRRRVLKRDHWWTGACLFLLWNCLLNSGRVFAQRWLITERIMFVRFGLSYKHTGRGDD